MFFLQFWVWVIYYYSEYEYNRIVLVYYHQKSVF